jgi:hypothetical protein
MVLLNSASLFRAFRGDTQKKWLTSGSWGMILQINSQTPRLIVPTGRSQVARYFAQTLLIWLPIVLLIVFSDLVLAKRLSLASPDWTYGSIAIALATISVAAIVISQPFAFLLGDVFLIRFQAKRPDSVVELKVKDVDFGKLIHVLKVSAGEEEFRILVAGKANKLKRALDSSLVQS